MKENINSILSFDLWNTLIRVNPKSRQNLADFIANHSELDNETVAKTAKEVTAYFDKEAIKSGVDVPSREKIAKLIGITGAKLSPEDIEDFISKDLEVNPPSLLERDGLAFIDNACEQYGAKYVIASNSGLAGTKTLQKVIARLGFTGSSCFSGAFFSDETGFAKPSREFFGHIEDKLGARIAMHIGDKFEADVDLPSGYLGLLFAPAGDTKHSHVNTISSLGDITLGAIV